MSLRPIVEGDPCCYCRAEIIFARTRAGKLMPLDAEPVQAKLVPPLSRWLGSIREDEAHQGAVKRKQRQLAMPWAETEAPPRARFEVVVTKVAPGVRGLSQRGRVRCHAMVCGMQCRRYAHRTINRLPLCWQHARQRSQS